MSSLDFGKKYTVAVNNDKTKWLIIYQNLFIDMIKIEVLSAWVNFLSDWTMWLNSLDNFLIDMLIG